MLRLVYKRSQYSFVFQTHWFLINISFWDEVGKKMYIFFYIIIR